MVDPFTMAAGSAAALYDYNRENYFFNMEQQLSREFQVLRMRVTQFELYREDIRDLVGLTVSKMDNYLVVNAILLGFCTTLLTQGRPEDVSSPQWVHWLYSMTSVSAFFYALLSIWLSMHASIAAHSFGVRMLTQLVRLPLPSSQQLDAVTAKARDFEKLTGAEMLRIPVVQTSNDLRPEQWMRAQVFEGLTGAEMLRMPVLQTSNDLRRLNAQVESLTAAEAPGSASPAAAGGGSPDDGASDPGSDASGLSPAVRRAAALVAPVAALKHVRVYRELQANWQAYDAYSRVCMAMAANQLLHAISYYALMMLVSEERSPWPAVACLSLLAFCAWLLARLDLYLSPRLLKVAGALLLAPPCTTMVGITLSHIESSTELQSDIFAPITFLLHLAWITFILYIAKAEQRNGVALPMNFRSVLYLDVFGWLSDPPRAPRPRLDSEPVMVVAEAGGDGATELAEDLGRRRRQAEDDPAMPSAFNSNSFLPVDIEVPERREAPPEAQDAQPGPAAGSDPEHFGGQEATASHIFLEAARGRNGFHPYQPRSTARGSRRSQRPPGEMPWRTFCNGSLFIMLVWVIGFTWSALRVLDRKIDHPVGAPLLVGTADFRPVFGGPWPHAFFAPAGLACGANGSHLLMESFGVHVLSTVSAGSEQALWRPALARCLAQEPEFQAAGLRSLALLCAAGSPGALGADAAASPAACSAVLLATDGTAALRCEGRGAESVASWLVLHGGPWRALAVTGPGHPLGAIRQEDGAMVWLRRSGGADSRDLVPEFEWPAFSPGAAPAQLLQAQVLARGVLLGLRESGLVQALDLRGDVNAPPRWALQLPRAFKWDQMCVAVEEEAVYLLARERRRSGRGVRRTLWRLGLPHEVFAAVEAW